jgi:DNA-directed RNA polymerase subunit RPC12/RpoP
MYDTALKCTICKAFIDEEDLFCANCGTEAPRVDGAKIVETQQVTHAYSCRGCGASMSYDASAQTLRCPFCGSDRLDQEQSTQKTLTAQLIVRFRFDRAQVNQVLKQWMGSSFWRPKDLASTSTITNMAPVFVPYWVFNAKTHTFWTADSSVVPWGKRGDWAPISGQHASEYRGVVVGASSVLSPRETFAICPFNLELGETPDQVDLDNYVVEQFRVQRKFARPMARASIEELERDSCRKYVPGRARNVHVNVQLEGLIGQPVLLPVWVLAYRYKGDLYRFLANGQTGKHTGTAPISWWRVTMVIAIVIACILGILGLISLFAMIAN